MDLDELQEAKGFRDTVSTVNSKGERNWVYAAQVSGFFYRRRTILTVLYLLLLFGMPFIKVNGLPFVQFNIPAGKIILFSKIFWPEDFFIFALAMIAFVLFIALFTVIYGRLFCGWACPQTIFMEFIFRPIEWWIEGSPGAQKQLNNGPWTVTKTGKKVIKHIIFFTVSLLIAFTFLSYILGVERLSLIYKEGIAAHTSLFIGIVIFALLFYFVFAFIRDIVCTTICPYGRLQGVLYDKNTMQVAYDYRRGEPRAKFSKKKPADTGDCIDCHQCVAVCPTGIDIRNGLQMECVGCTACIDICDRMMEKVGYPKGLIRYASENSISEGKKFVFTPRIKAYTTALSILVIIISILLIRAKDISTHISRSSGQTYQEADSTAITNLYNAKILNKTIKDADVELKIENLPAQVIMVGEKAMHLHKESINSFTFFVKTERKNIIRRKTTLLIGVYKNGQKIDEVNTSFIGPFI